MNPATKTPENALCILGIPFDENSSFRKGALGGPARIRESYISDSANLWTETGIDLGNHGNLFDVGDVDCSGKTTETFHRITDSVKTLLDHNNRVISLGGDHSVTFPVIRAFADYYPNLNILHLDAHPDLYDSLKDNPLSHACPFARIMEQKLAGRLVQAGIRTMTGHLRDQAEKFNVEVHEVRFGMDWLDSLEFEGPVYLSIDLDCMDPAFAPGVSHHEPGGLSSRQVIDIIQKFKGQLIGGDIVELNPDRDFISMTAMTAAKLLKEMMGRILES
ncbi:MAG: agmatinase [Desulfobacterales bacterium]|nr:agmatinase [Desulfobacterales bacterium]